MHIFSYFNTQCVCQNNGKNHLVLKIMKLIKKVEIAYVIVNLAQL